MNFTVFADSLRLRDHLHRSGNQFSWFLYLNYVFRLCFQNNDRIRDDQNEGHGVGRFFLSRDRLFLFLVRFG